MTVKAKSWGYVYIVKSLQRYKIGWSGDLKTLKRRINRLNLMNAYGVDPVIIIRNRRAHIIETQLHKQYSDKNTHGEWFCLEAEDLQAISNQYIRSIYTVQELKL